MIGFYNYTVVLTYMSVLSALFGIFQAADGRPLVAIVCLMVCAGCDMFDGQVARTKKNRTKSEEKFGIQIDSLADILSFGLLPAVIGYSLGMTTWYYMIILAVYVLAALIRLAYFNVTEEERQAKTSEKRKSYEGLPVPNCAIFLPIAFCLQKLVGELFTPIFAAVMLAVAVAFVIKFRVVKVGMKGLLVFVALGAVTLTLVFLLCK